MKAKAPKVGMVSLGCAKNLIDAEIMLGAAGLEGFEITSDPSDADVLIVNTCGFIDSAKQESIDAILEAHERRRGGEKKKQKLVVSGCLSQRFSKELAAELREEVDAFIGLDQVAEAGSILRGILETEGGEVQDFVGKGSKFVPDWDTPRFRLTPAHTCYVKIAEGCNHPCSFCVIPQMRGRHRSRTIASVVEEVRRLVADGVKEINLISQDTTFFGMDLWEEKAGPRQPVDSGRGPTISGLLDALGALEGDFWIRLLYTHPAHWSDDLIQAIARNPKVVRYVDIPLQHIHSELLKTMKRETTREHIENLLDRLRAGIPGLALRTTFIVGFPGETEEHFASLLEFIEGRRFERLGVFVYSQEEGSKAAKLEGQVPEKVKNQRYRKAMKLQKKIAEQIAKEQIGKRIRVLTEGGNVARSGSDAPEVDCRVLLEKPVSAGQFLAIEVTGTLGYDLEGRILEDGQG